jgi:hypothetical protein
MVQQLLLLVDGVDHLLGMYHQPREIDLRRRIDQP